MTITSQPLPSANDPDSDLPHRPADDSEQVYFQGTPKLRGDLAQLIIFWIVGLIIIVAPLFYWLAKNAWPVWWVPLGCFVIGASLLTIPAVMIRMTRYRISNYRIDVERGLLSRSIDTLELWHVEDISFHQTLLDRMLGVGDITVMSHDETTPKLVLESLPHPRPLFDSLKQRIIAVKRQRGVIKMDTGDLGHGHAQ